jgi:hypothetical protein
MKFDQNIFINQDKAEDDICCIRMAVSQDYVMCIPDGIDN